MTKIILSSFKVSKSFRGKKFSVARWQPQEFNYPELEFFAAKDKEGNSLHLHLFKEKENPLKRYREEWFKMVYEKGKETKDWIHCIQNEKEVVLCCWCPYSRSTKEQIRKFGSFACHTGLIGKFLIDHFKNIIVVLDDDRKNFLVKGWRP